MKLVIAIVIIGSLVGMACTSLAGLNPNAKIGVHLATHAAKRACTSLPVITSRADLVRQWEAGLGPSVDAILYIWGYTEFQGFDIGMTWPVEWGSGAFTHCGTLGIGKIVEPSDTGISWTYTECQTPSGFAGIGWLWLYPSSMGDIGIRGRSDDDLVEILDCHLGKDQPETVYWACREKECIEGPPRATEPRTWGSIKALFK